MQHFQNLCKTMNGLLESATRFSLVVCVTVLALCYTLVVVFNVRDQQVILGVKETFGGIAFMIIGFYFGKQVPVTPPPNTSISATNVEIPPQSSNTP